MSHKPVFKGENFEMRDLATLSTLHLRADITWKCRMFHGIVGDESGDSTKSDTTCSQSHSWICIMRLFISLVVFYGSLHTYLDCSQSPIFPFDRRDRAQTFASFVFKSERELGRAI